MQLKTSSPEQTYAFGEALAKKLKSGLVLCLEGDLGVGKTLFVQGLAAGFKVKEEVTSPTFALMNVYHGDYMIYHFDLYRLEHAEELLDIGFYEYTQQKEAIIIIEWPNKFPEELPEEYLWIKIERGKSESERIFIMHSKGIKDQLIDEELKESCQF